MTIGKRRNVFFCSFVSNPITEGQQGVLGGIPGRGQTNCVSKSLNLHKLKNLTSGKQSPKENFFTSFSRKKWVSPLRLSPGLIRGKFVLRITLKGCLHTWDQQTESGWPSSDRLSVYSSNKIGVHRVCVCVCVCALCVCMCLCLSMCVCVCV